MTAVKTEHSYKSKIDASWHTISTITAKQESILFQREGKAWHGLGQTVEQYPTSAEAIKYAGLDYQVAKSPLYTKGSEILVTREGIEVGSLNWQSLTALPPYAPTAMPFWAW